MTYPKAKGKKLTAIMICTSKEKTIAPHMKEDACSIERISMVNREYY